MKTLEQREPQSTPNQELDNLKKELEEKGYVVTETSQRGQKTDVTIKNDLGQEGSGEGYTYETALKKAITALDYIIKNKL
ncbi:MAG: hypothetical protein PHS07_03620 [Patescibacteria group bacterium]|nr:hypothetical protein [Patescibacteria group bacterium]MDD4607387.1 hypothetical protein [Patescibacteria group bacterium]